MKKIKRRMAMILFCVLGSTFVLSGCQKEENKEKESYGEVEIGMEAPDFEVELLSGESVRLSDYKGKIVLLNFWATWCGLCVAEMPEIQEISEVYSDDVVVLAVNNGERKDTVEKFIDKNSFTFLVGTDESLGVAKKYPTDGIPYTVMVDKEGIISAIHLGGGEGMYSVFEEDIKNILE